MKHLMIAGSLLAAISLAGCGETDQKAKTEKIYAGKKDTRAAEAPAFGGDQKKWEATLAARNSNQNEYLRTQTKK